MPIIQISIASHGHCRLAVRSEQWSFKEKPINLNSMRGINKRMDRKASQNWTTKSGYFAERGDFAEQEKYVRDQGHAIFNSVSP